MRKLVCSWCAQDWNQGCLSHGTSQVIVEPIEVGDIESKLALAKEALESCATNDFKIEKTQNVAREALEKLK